MPEVEGMPLHTSETATNHALTGRIPHQIWWRWFLTASPCTVRCMREEARPRKPALNAWELLKDKFMILWEEARPRKPALNAWELLKDKFMILLIRPEPALLAWAGLINLLPLSLSLSHTHTHTRAPPPPSNSLFSLFFFCLFPPAPFFLLSILSSTLPASAPPPPPLSLSLFSHFLSLSAWIQTGHSMLAVANWCRLKANNLTNPLFPLRENQIDTLSASNLASMLPPSKLSS